MIEALFWISIGAILYTYLGYPIVVWLLARVRKREVIKADIVPLVSVVIACHNEQDNIRARINNLLVCNYPRDLLEIVIVSDGSTDFTPEIIVFADSRQSFERDAIKELAANFADPSVGAASGELLLDGAGGSSVGEGVGLYWKYEKWIRRSESRSGSTIGATGAIYGIRRELWRPLPESTILDDVYTPMRIALGGHRVVFDETARAHDKAAESAGHEFARKVRTLTGNYQLCQLMPRLLFPNSALLFQFYSHKLMRLGAPIFMLIILAANFLLATTPPNNAAGLFYRVALAGQLFFYAGVALAAYLLKHNRRIRLLNLAYVFSLMNAAALIGLLFFLLGKRDVWVKRLG